MVLRCNLFELARANWIAARTIKEYRSAKADYIAAPALSGLERDGGGADYR